MVQPFSWDKHSLEALLVPARLSSDQNLSETPKVKLNMHFKPPAEHQRALSRVQGLIRNSGSRVRVGEHRCIPTHGHGVAALKMRRFNQWEISSLHFFPCHCFPLLLPFPLASFSSALHKMIVSWERSSQVKQSWQLLERMECLPRSQLEFRKATSACS